MAFNSRPFSTGATLTLTLNSLSVAILPRHYLQFEVPEGTTGASQASCLGNGIPLLTTFPNRNGEEISYIRVELTPASSFARGSNVVIICSPLTVPVSSAEDGLTFRVDAFELVLRSGTMTVPFQSSRYSGRATVTITGHTNSVYDNSIKWRITPFARPLSPGSAFFFQLPTGFALTDQTVCTVSAAMVLPLTPVYVGALGASGSSSTDNTTSAALPWYGVALPENGSYSDNTGVPIDTVTCSTVQFPSYASSAETPTRIVQLYKTKGRHITVADDIAVFPSTIATESSTTRVALSHPYAHASSLIVVAFAGIAGGYKKGDFIALALPSATVTSGSTTTAAVSTTDAPFVFANPNHIECVINNVPGATGAFINNTLAVSYPGDIAAISESGVSNAVAVTCAGAHMGPARSQVIAAAAMFSDAGVKATSATVVIPAIEPAPSMFSTATLTAKISTETGLARVELTLAAFPTAMAEGDQLLLGLPQGWYHYTGAGKGEDACHLELTLNSGVTTTASGLTSFEPVGDSAGTTATATPTLSTDMSVSEMRTAVAYHQYTLVHRITATSVRLAGSSSATLKLICNNMLAPEIDADSVRVTAVVGTNSEIKPIFFSQNVLISRIAPDTPAVVTTPTTTTTPAVTTPSVTDLSKLAVTDFLLLPLSIPSLTRQLTVAESAAVTAAVASALGQSATITRDDGKPRIVRERMVDPARAATAATTASGASATGSSSTTVGTKSLEVTVGIPTGPVTELASLADLATGKITVTARRAAIAEAVGKALGMFVSAGSVTTATTNGVVIVDIGYPESFSLPATCLDDKITAKETDVDCGGGCFPCVTGRRCSAHADCASSLCGSAGLCVAYSATATAQNSAVTAGSGGQVGWLAAVSTSAAAIVFAIAGLV